jgi:2'-5' RNA ligase
MRLFYALWPAPATQREWYDAAGSLLVPWGGRRMPAENLHLTLHFLGDLPADRMNELCRLGQDAAAEAIALRFDRIEAWGKADLSCLRADDTPALTRLYGQLGTGLTLAGIATDKRRFKPHITLARDLNFVQGSLPLWPVLEWRADTLALVRSRLGPLGPAYSVVASWPLG